MPVTAGMPRSGATGGRARQAVAPGAEGRPRHQRRGTEGLQLAPDGLDGGLLLLRHMVVAADDRAHDPRMVAQGRLERAPGPDRLGTHRHADRGALLAADSAEELVEIVGDAQRLGHGAPPRGAASISPGAARRPATTRSVS
jgi:hypothetical protein